MAKKSSKKLNKGDEVPDLRKGVKARNFIEEKIKSAGTKGKPLTADSFLEIWKFYDKDGMRNTIFCFWL
jgi:hypothetical protein